MRYERILLTAFEPWADERVNSSWIAIEPLEGQTLHAAKVKAISLPVDRQSSLRLLREAAHAFKPDAIVAFGMLRKERGIWRVEILARNRDQDAPIEKDGPAIVPTGLPAARIRGKLSDAGLQAEFSENAGDFVCNHLFYRMMLLAESGALPAAAGFVHVPPPERAEDGTIENEGELQEGAHAVVEALAAPRF